MLRSAAGGDDHGAVVAAMFHGFAPRMVAWPWWPEASLAVLWQAATVLREYRGDGHVVVLIAQGLGGCQAHVLRDAADGSRSLTQVHRGFTDDEWAATVTVLQARQVLDRDGGLTRRAGVCVTRWRSAPTSWPHRRGRS